MFMWKIRGLVLSFVLLLLMGCQSSETLTPTPFPPTPDDGPLGISASLITPVPVVLADVMANPEFYEGAYLMVTGQYFRRPLQVCGSDPHPSPAGWELVTGETRVPAGGFNAQLRQLFPDGITMTVIGRFTHWQGPVGCGKQAVTKEMWYLDVVKIIDPSQLARVTLTPSSSSGDSISEGIITDELFTPIADSEGFPPDEDAFLPTSPPVAPPTNTPTRLVPIETLSAGFTPVATEDIGISTPYPSGTNGTVTAVPNGTSQSTLSTSTSTPRPGSTSPPSNGSPTPIPTIRVGGSTVTIKDDTLSELDFRAVGLQSYETHEWPMSLFFGEEVVISVVGEPTMNLGITIYDEDLNIVKTQDASLAGLPEILYFDPPEMKDYKVRISERNGIAGGYLLTIGVDPILLNAKGLLTYGLPRGGTVYEDELDYWFFKGQKGDVIDITISSEAGADTSTLIFTADGNDLGGLDEVITLPDIGWYIIELEEFGLDQNSYDITVSKR